MKKVILILVALQILLTSSSNHQGVISILKFGSFFHHFAHHIICKQENINLIEFVVMHYTNHDHNKTDHSDHENLPFQNHPHDQQNISPQIPCLLPHINTMIVFNRLKIVAKSLILQSQQLHFSIYLGDIWQPPKIN